MKKKISGKLMMIAGTVLISSAFSIIIYNRHESVQAGIKSEYIISKITAEGSTPSDTYISENDNYQYSDEEGLGFAGILRIPELDIELPVCSDFSMSSLKNYPCVYMGSISEKNTIIAAHNYESHFGNIKFLEAGDKVFFKTASGTEFVYEVFSIDIVSGNEPDKLLSGEWDLTLFTCTKSGTDRVTVRCSEVIPLSS